MEDTDEDEIPIFTDITFKDDYLLDDIKQVESGEFDISTPIGE